MQKYFPRKPVESFPGVVQAHRLMPALLAVCSVLVALASIPLASSSAIAQEAAAEQAEEFTMNMREADVRAFIQWVANRTGKNIIIHRSVRGAVTVISSRPVNADEAYELFLAVLQLNGFAAVEGDTAIRVIPENDAKTSALPFAGEVAQGGAKIVLRIVDVEHADASKLVATLRPLIPASGYIDAYVETNSVIIADSSANLEKLETLVQLFDQPGQTDVEIVKIVHASATEIVNMLKNVSGPQGGESGKVEFVVDTRSNAILMTGNPISRQQMRELIKRLDIPLEGQGNTQVVYLNYIDASEIVPILKSVGDSVLKDSKLENKNFSIESSETTNALVISAPPALLNSFRSIIEKLDFRRAQVLVEAVVVQVSARQGDDIGVIWGTGEVRSSNPDGSAAAVNTLGTEEAALFADTDADSDTGSVATALLAGNGLTYGYFKDGDLLAALRAVTTKTKSNIMSTPTIVALDNEEASLLVGRNVPFVTGSQTSSSSSTANPFQTIQREDVGVTLDITPRINQGDSITLEIEQTTENVIDNDVNASDLITEKTEIKTSALIRDGEVLVIGGLISNNQVKNRTQVPLLGSIPGLGRLFRSDSLTNEKNNLMVFIRTTILKDELQVEGITANRYAFMREKQLQAALRNMAVDREPPLLDEFETFSPRAKQTETDIEIDS